MKDFFGAYRKSAVKKNAAIAAAAFVFAVSINTFLFGTDAGVKIQTSASEYAGGGSNRSVESDLVLVSAGTGSDLVKLRLGKSAKAVSEVRATLVSNADALKVKDVFTTDASAEIVKVSNVDGLMLVNVRFKSPKDLAAGTDLATIAYVKSGTGKTAMSFAETSFVSGSESYELTNESIEL